MKKLIFLLLVSGLAFTANAQVKDNAVESLMDKRVLTCDDIYYNSITLIPRLYREKKMDTLNAVLSYWKKNCGMNEAAVCYTILASIEDGTFREELTNTYKDTTKGNSLADVMYYKNNIISYLTANRDFSRIDKTPNEYPHFYHVAYVEYSKFIRAMAASMLNKPGLSPAEHFLVEYYANPDTVRLEKLMDSVYRGSLLYQAYKGNDEFGGVSYGLNYGMWHPLDKLGVLGDHPFFGFLFGGRSNGFSCDFVMNFSVGRSANYVYVKKDDTLRYTNDFTGYYIGLDFGQALFRTKHHEVAALCGIAYDGLTLVEASTTNTTDRAKTLNSLNLNAGLGYKFYYKHKITHSNRNHSYFGIQAKYNFVSYRNQGGTDLTGNSINFCLIWGGYSNPIHQYYEK